MTKKEQQQAVQLAKRFIREMHPKEIKENPALRAYLIEGFIAGYHGAVCTASSWLSVDECLPEVEEVFNRLSSQEQTEFINERVDLASDEALERELIERGHKVELM